MEKSRAYNGSSVLLFGAVLAAIAAGGYFFFAHSSPKTADANPIPSASTPSNSGQTQSQPQGPTGPINTRKDGSSASSPEGETPGGMQVQPKGPSGSSGDAK